MVINVIKIFLVVFVLHSQSGFSIDFFEFLYEILQLLKENKLDADSALGNTDISVRFFNENDIINQNLSKNLQNKFLLEYLQQTKKIALPSMIPSNQKLRTGVGIVSKVNDSNETYSPCNLFPM